MCNFNILCTAVTVYTVCSCACMCADVRYCIWHSDVAFERVSEELQFYLWQCQTFLFSLKHPHRLLMPPSLLVSG